MVSARSNLVGRLGVFYCTGARDFSVGFRAAVTIELPGVTDFLNFIEIQFGDQQFILVAAGLLHDFPARVAEIALAVEFADLPGSFRADAVDGGDKVGVSNRVRRLLQFPEIFGKAGDSGRRVVDDFRAVESEDARAFWEVAARTKVNPHPGGNNLGKRGARISRRVIQFFSNTRGR